MQRSVSSTAEGLPLFILEAQASRTPVLVAPTARIPEVVIDGKTGFLVEQTTLLVMPIIYIISSIIEPCTHK